MTALSRATYRVGQLRASLFHRPTEEDVLWVRSILNEREHELFLRMPVYDQTHSLDVARSLSNVGEHMVKAALLHDCGKTIPGHGVPLIYRGAVVLLSALSHQLVLKLAVPRGPLWPIYLHVHHPRIGADALSRAGSSQAVVELVRHHQDDTHDPETLRFQAADDQH